MSTDMQDIPLAKLEPHPHNVRRQLQDLDDLSASIKAKGIVQALTVVPHPTAKTKYVVLGGHRRLAAAKLAKVKTAPCMIREDLATPEAQTEFMIVENTQRNDLSPMEEARAYQQLLELPGYNAKKISENTGRKPRLVQDRIKLAKVTDPIAAKLDSGQITLEQALVFAEFADDSKATKKLLDDVGSYNWDYRVRSLRQEKKAAAEAVRTRKALAALGVEPMARPEGWPWRSEYAPVPAGGLTPAEHVAAGHKPLIDGTGHAEWAILRSELPDAEAPREPTPEEIAEAEEYERIKAGLDVADHVRRQHLEDIFATPPAGLAARLFLPRVVSTFTQLKSARGLIGLSEEAKPADIEATLAKLSLEQLVVVDGMAGVYNSADLLNPDYWGEGRYGNDFTKGQRDRLANLFGYQWSDIEKEAMERLRLKAEERRARIEREKAAEAAKQAEGDEEADDADAA
ncbi:ParB/RepB/Spo0J family partition protein [Arthrobacter sp. B1805]|uniref:ParB/RepB/Spo0J family partition protein n=1 Tax=Arthrobacter sp. B1805 TaxID=2058892 RepID=UPI000CE41303|nr:ParB/RepB/Spo0J family partition protein [Arthrobacter sp. B1805]